jgi:ATP-dependent Zn protease
MTMADLKAGDIAEITGYTLGNASGEMTAEARERVYELLERQMARACEIVDAEWSSLNAVAQALIERQSLSEDELAALLKG